VSSVSGSKAIVDTGFPIKAMIFDTDGVVTRTTAAPFATTVRFIESLREAGIPTAATSASRNCRDVLESAGVALLFDAHVDGVDVEQQGLAGKPAPDVFLEAARRLGVPPAHAGVVDEARAGIDAARRGEFGLVVGLDRTAHPEAFASADLVVSDLGDLMLTGGNRIVRLEHPTGRVHDLASALDDPDVNRRLEGRMPAVFLDYDGTLTPIVARPELATLAPEMHAALASLARTCPVGIISGRDLDDVRSMVAVEHLWFSGSHGLDLLSPDGERSEAEQADALRPALDAAEQHLVRAVGVVPGAWVERKRFAIAVHFRQSPAAYEPQLIEIVTDTAASHPGLRTSGGKKIVELRPDIEWDKGRALGWILERADLQRDDVLPVYVGDDVTDEDAFLAVRSRGLGVVVATDDRQTAAHNRLRDPEEVEQFLELLTHHAEQLAGGRHP
jgi:alpha,alpha-trehalase